MLSRPITELEQIVLPSLTVKPANVIHLWIEEDLIYTSVHVCQWFGFGCRFCSETLAGVPLGYFSSHTVKPEEVVHTSQNVTNFYPFYPGRK